MKSLALYIDKWYIIGAVCVDGIPRPVKLPNNEDRFWLFFHEDTINDTVTYGKAFESHYRNIENLYYGDIFSNINNSAATFTKFKQSQPIKDIFKMSNVFEDLKEAFGTNEDIPTYLSFSNDIKPAARLTFNKELEGQGFKIIESVARIDHLALEYATKKNGLSGEGYYLVLNACNENLHYSIYKKSSDLFLRTAESSLPGMGTDLRSRCLVEYVVDHINQTEHFLKTKEEQENEYLRCSQFSDEWILKLSTASPFIPPQITGVTLAKDPHKTYSVTVLEKDIDDKTEVTSKRIVDEIAKFVREKAIRHEEVAGIVFLGNTFTNKKFTSQFFNHYTLKDNSTICYGDKDICMLVSEYNSMDCSQFSELSKKLAISAEDELQRLKNAEEERIAKEKAMAEADRYIKIEQAKKEKEAKFSQAMEKGCESESSHDYEKMAEYFGIAKDLCPDSEEAKAKYEEALSLKAKQSVMMETYRQKLQQARTALDEKDWELAKQKAEEALSSNQESEVARHIKEEASHHISQQKDFERYIDRADLFCAQKLYSEACEELEKAMLLNIDDKTVKSKIARIKNLENSLRSKIEILADKLDTAVNNNKFDNAITVCNQLIEIDTSNNIKWTNKIAQIKLLQKEEEAKEKEKATLTAEIDKAQWSDDWQKVADKCSALLALTKSEDIKKKLAIAKEKLVCIKENEAFDKAVAEINGMIVHNEFREVKSKIDLIKKKFSDPKQQRLIKDLYKQVFDRENQFESTHPIENPSKPSPRKIIGFKLPKEEAEKEKSKPDNFFDDDFPPAKHKPAQMAQRNKKSGKPKQADKGTFFDSAGQEDGSASTKGFTLSDFDF